jgi:CRP-like cAMP-binding protein
MSAAVRRAAVGVVSGGERDASLRTVEVVVVGGGAVVGEDEVFAGFDRYHSSVVAVGRVRAFALSRDVFAKFLTGRAARLGKWW